MRFGSGWIGFLLLTSRSMSIAPPTFGRGRVSGYSLATACRYPLIGLYCWLISTHTARGCEILCGTSNFARSLRSATAKHAAKASRYQWGIPPLMRCLSEIRRFRRKFVVWHFHSSRRRTWSLRDLMPCAAGPRSEGQVGVAALPQTQASVSADECRSTARSTR